MRIRVSVQAQKIELRLVSICSRAIRQLAVPFEDEARTVGVLVGVKEYVRAIVFVVTIRLAFIP